MLLNVATKGRIFILLIMKYKVEPIKVKRRDMWKVTNELGQIANSPHATKEEAKKHCDFLSAFFGDGNGK